MTRSQGHAKGRLHGLAKGTLLPVAPSSSRVATQVMKVSSLREGSAQRTKVAVIQISRFKGHTRTFAATET